MLAAVTCNAAPFRKKGAKTFQPADFFGTLKAVERTQSPKAMLATAMLITARMGGKIIRQQDATDGRQAH